MNPVSLAKSDDLGREQIVAHASPMPMYRTVEGTQVTGTSGNQANATAAAAIPGVAGKMSYLAGFDITGAGATAASVVTATISGAIGGSLNYTVSVPAGATVGLPALSVRFDPPLQASAVNTAITLSVPALGAGNTNTCVNVFGYQR